MSAPSLAAAVSRGAFRVGGNKPLIPDPSPLGAGRRENTPPSTEPSLLSPTGEEVGGEGRLRLG